MARISQNAAARLCRVSRATIWRRLQRGALQLGADRRLDTADLVRLGLLDPDWETRQRLHPLPPPVTLRELLRGLRESLDRQDQLLQMQAHIVRLLEHCSELLVSLRSDVPRNHGAPC